MFCRCITRCAEIQKLHLQMIRFLRLQHINIIRCNIPVQKSRFMDCFHCRGHLQCNLYCLLGFHLSVLCKIFLQRLTLKQLHHDIRGAVFFKAIIDLHNPGNLLKFCEPLCFVDGFCQAIVKLLFPFSGIYGNLGLGRHSGCKLTRQIFLDGELSLHNKIPSDIGHSKTTVPKNPSYNISLL